MFIEITVKLASWFWKTSPPLSSSSPLGPSTSEPVAASPTPSSIPQPPTLRRNRKMSHGVGHSRPIAQLTPALCFNTGYIRDFLRLSRSQMDDTISTNLNSLLTPSVSRPFDPSSTSDPSTNRRGRQPVPAESCTEFLEQAVFPAWSSRSQLLSYCSIVATSPDPDDPDKTQIEAENMAQAHKVVDERLDPYSGRFFPKEPRTELLASVLRNENAVESIVRERTWRTLTERCAGSGIGSSSWQDAFKAWDAQYIKGAHRYCRLFI